MLFRGAETHARSVLKAVSWRTLGTLDTFAISWFMIGRVEIAGSIAGLEVVTKIAWYYLHERVWADIQWGGEGELVFGRREQKQRRPLKQRPISA
ncbi:DUF2061 domain-containing protein [Bradyrhizobium sp. Ash2021]|uniref:DUF2061 domain-containing protein n=1 Tax=Bradyrhizobium sp. Ash2021 TaxID=2954771 RepID=UPI002815EFCF|nr:DUF2061 domain-containing protein [Bradyrhizobium sp. Ash2021]WMT78722.1 DUF2061 domain-containing protein [Bradyrhizobium sp. Ash2021]